MPKFKDLKTANYHLTFIDGETTRTFVITRLADKAKTQKFTGADGQEIHRDLMRLHRNNRQGFNGYCARLFDRDAGIKGKLLEALKDCVESLTRLPDVEGAYRTTCINQACAVIAEVEKE